MKFYGVGAVWGGEDNKILCRFIDGELDTDDEKVIKKLLDNGYKHDGKQEKVVDEVPADAKVPIEPVKDEVPADAATNEEISAVEKVEAVVKKVENKPVSTGAKNAQVKKR